MSTIRMVQNDLEPDLNFTVKKDGDYYDLSGKEVHFSMKNAKTDLIKVDEEPCLIVEPASGLCRYVWQEGDTDKVGKFQGELQITSSGTNQRYTCYEEFDIIIRDEIT